MHGQEGRWLRSGPATRGDTERHEGRGREWPRRRRRAWWTNPVRVGAPVSRAGKPRAEVVDPRPAPAALI